MVWCAITKNKVIYPYVFYGNYDTERKKEQVQRNLLFSKGSKNTLENNSSTEWSSFALHNFIQAINAPKVSKYTAG